MFRFSRKPLILLSFLVVLCTCIDPYNPDLKKFESRLVVDALLTNENGSNFVKISRTTQVQNVDPIMVSGALVMIKANNGYSTTLKETSDGFYITDSLSFHGETGNSYTLYIKTTDGNEYESEPCLMYPVHQIGNIIYNKDQEISNNEAEAQKGIRISIDSQVDNNNTYLRWIYNEWWKVIVPDPKKYNYVNDSTIIEVDQLKQVCWRKNTSDGIFIQSYEAAQSSQNEKTPILFIASEKTNRLLIQYCIEIKQLSISKNEYEFWDQMKQISASGGDIFDKQPFPIVSNIHNLNDPNEAVLGYFQVSAVSRNKTYITNNDISLLDIPLYKYDCARIELGPSDFPPPLTPGGGMTFDKLYRLYVGDVYSFIEPIYDNYGNLIRLAFSKNTCADCTINGSLKKPDFWIDL